MRITADTNFLISATQWDNSISNKLLIRLIEQNDEIFTSEEILTEFANILNRDFKLDGDEISEIIEKLISFMNIIFPTTKIDIVKEDPSDNKIIECALESNSDLIITYDNHLLKLKEYGKIKIITPNNLFFNNYP